MPPALEGWSLNHWTTKGSPKISPILKLSLFPRSYRLSFKLYHMAPVIYQLCHLPKPPSTPMDCSPGLQTKVQTSTLSCFCMSLEGPHPHPFVHLAKFCSSPKAQLKCHFCCLVFPDSHPHPRLPLNQSLQGAPMAPRAKPPTWHLSSRIVVSYLLICLPS